ncbi:hypothetical protein GF380_05755, partial [Candidatus Uhrbacteria bacterium]|nr:hypothetical protein [Candidatus Uhrbacteria bacterium]
MAKNKNTQMDEDIRPTINETVRKVYASYVDAYEVMSNPHPFLQDMSPFDYFDEGRRIFNSYVPAREDDQDWRTQYRSNMTRNRALGLIAHTVTKNIEPSIVAQNVHQEEDGIVARFFKDTVEYSQEHEGWEDLMFWVQVTLIAEGTVTVQDNYGEFKRPVKEITGFDNEGNVNWTKREHTDFVGAYTEIIPNDELMPEDPYKSEIQEQGWIIRRRRMPFERAKRFYGHYEAWDEVKPGSTGNWAYQHDI